MCPTGNGVAAFIIIAFNCLTQAYGVCYFGQDLQGFYLTQSTVSRGTDIDYLEVVVLHDAIPVWGSCRRRFGNNVILYDVAGNMECLRCFYFVSRSSDILEVHTEGLERCYTNEGAALTRCPTQDSVAAGATSEIMLYKTKHLLESKSSPPVYCPINGIYKTTYDFNDGKETVQECPHTESVISNCPKGSEMVIGFKGCTFSNFEKKFECLGSWPATNGQKYLALRDPSVQSNYGFTKGFENRIPRYRCALFKEEKDSGRIYLSFSSDSTCFNNLHSAWEGFESLVLLPQKELVVPKLINSSNCEFPAWSQGQWEHLRINGGQMTYLDAYEYKTFNVYCLEPPVGGLFPVYAQSHCGEEIFACLAMEERSSNVIEFQISVTSYAYYNHYLCDNPSTLKWPQWTTQSRVDRFRESPCPVLGEYTGMIPDEPSLCTKLYSDCNNPEIMFYSVSSCVNKSEVFEEREYRCLGQWKESGVTYTYTERRDLEEYECFAGVVVSNEEIFIIEAGLNCQRGLKPLSKGMKLLKQANCRGVASSKQNLESPEEATPSWWSSTETPWRRTQGDVADAVVQSRSSTVLFCLSIFIFFSVR